MEHSTSIPVISIIDRFYRFQFVEIYFVFQNLTREQADYCISHMKPYMDSKGRELPSSYDYVEFTRSLFVN